MAANDNSIYGFNRQDAQSLIQMISTGASGMRPTILPQAPSYIAYTPVGGIAARSGSTISSANCTIYRGVGGTLQTASLDVPVYNLSTTAVAANKYIVCMLASGVLVAVWEDC